MDVLTHEHNLSLSEILQLTTREISWRMKSISKRLREEAIFYAQIHGRAMKKTFGASAPKSTLSDEKRRKLDDYLTKQVRNG